MRNSTKIQDTPKENKDLFACEHCGISLVVDHAATGVILRCQGCGQPVAAPQGPNTPVEGTAPKLPERMAELRRHLKENESQRIEVRGYINQLSIQLHRWQLRLQVLEERNQLLTTEIAGLPSDEK